MKLKTNKKIEKKFRKTNKKNFLEKSNKVDKPLARMRKKN